MENLIRPTTPHWMVILLISLIVVAVVSMIGFIISIVNRNGKIGLKTQLIISSTIKTATIISKMALIQKISSKFLMMS